jgi:hypothetical protein
MRKLHAIAFMKTHPLVYIGCHLQLRQIAREVFRIYFEPDDETATPADTHPLFPDLQWRYPTARKVGDGEPEYVILTAMTRADVRYNCKRLRYEGRAKLQHADALEAWGELHAVDVKEPAE